MKTFCSFALLVGCFLLQLCVQDVLSSELSMDPPSSPSIYTFDNWRELKHTDQATYADSSVPLPPVSNSWQDPSAEIFVGVVSYRDARCATTISNIFSKAEFPDRIRIGEKYIYESLSLVSDLPSLSLFVFQALSSKCRPKRTCSRAFGTTASSRAPRWTTSAPARSRSASSS